MLSSPIFLLSLVLCSSLIRGRAWTAPIPIVAHARRRGSRNARLPSASCCAAPLSVKGGSDAAEAAIATRVPRFLFALNASTKWLVTVAHGIAVWSRPKSFDGPFIVVGTIAAVYVTEILKKWINQGRPEGAPFSDPGMPSSHSLVSFFAAAAWMGIVGAHAGRAGRVLLVASAAIVAALRVICGYHTLAQIAVGSAIGVVLGSAWAALGSALHLSNPQIAFALAWTAYLAGSVLFIKKRMTGWVRHEKHL